MAKPVEITIPTEASGTASGTIPATAVPAVAEALRHGREQADGETDEEFIARSMVDFAREELEGRTRVDAIRQAIEDSATAGF